MRVLVRLAGYAWRHKPRLLLAYLSMAGATVAAIAIPKMLGSAIDEAISSGIRQELLVLGLAIVATSVLRGIFSYMQNYMSESLSQMAAFDLRNDFFRKLQSLSFGYHDQQQTGKPDVQGHRRRRGRSPVYQYGDDTSPVLADDGVWCGYAHADDQLEAGSDQHGVPAAHRLAGDFDGPQASEAPG